jgi:hypothetical protein
VGHLLSCTRLRPRRGRRKFARLLGTKRGSRMDLSIILLGLVGLAIVLALMHVASKMATERESAGRRKDHAPHKQERIVPLTNDTDTHSGPWLIRPAR